MSTKIAIVLASIICVSWGYLVYQSWQMEHLPMTQMWMPPSVLAKWGINDFFWVFSMWATMMAAMMLPSAMPTLKAFSLYCRKNGDNNSAGTIWFGSGYFAVWLLFSVVLTGMQSLFHGWAWLSPMMENRQPLLSVMIFLTAGAYQFTAFKNACLNYCRSPFGYLLNHWRPGYRGAFQVGFQHGLSCLGCCWAQMLIMFAIGVMSLPGMLMITLLVIVEKWVSLGAKTLSYSIGVSFLLWGGYILTAII